MIKFIVTTAFLSSVVGSYFAIRQYLRFALDRQIFDIPNVRSSHTAPTPRGAGVAFAVVFLLIVAALGMAHLLLAQELLAISASALIAAVGHWDDRFGLTIRIRLAVQVFASSVVVYSLASVHVPGRASSSLLIVGVLMAFEIFGLVWLLNLTNFMDGIDGIVTVEVVTVTAVCAGLIFSERGLTISALLFALLGTTVAPFLLFNWSPAKIFMGDAGSCFLGFILGTLSLVAAARHEMSVLCPLILFAVFITDATSTLVTRMLTGQRWYLAHRTHGFQILALRHGHRRVAGSVAIINLVWLAPLALAAEFDQAHGLLYVIAAFAPLIITCRVLSVGLPIIAAESPLFAHTSGAIWPGSRVEGLLHRFSSSVQLALLAILSLMCAYAAVRFHLETSVSLDTRTVLTQSVVLWSFCQCLVLGCLRLHRSHWRFSSIEELPALAGVSLLGSTIGAVCAYIFTRMHGVALPRSSYLLEAALSLLAFAGMRIFFRQLPYVSKRMVHRGERKPTIICNADLVGISIVSQIRLHHPEYQLVGFIDERPEVRGISICGIRVLGKREDLKHLIKKYAVHHVFISQKTEWNDSVEAIRSDCFDENVSLHTVSTFAFTSAGTLASRPASTRTV